MIEKLLKDKQILESEVKKEVNTDEDIKIQCPKIKEDKKGNLGKKLFKIKLS